MREDINARLEQALQTYRQMRTDLAAVQEAQAQAVGEAKNKDGLIQVRVTSGGRITELSISERAMRRYSGTELAAEILSSIAEANAKLNEATIEQYRSVLGPQFDPDAMNGDLDSLQSVVQNTAQHLFGR